LDIVTLVGGLSSIAVNPVGLADRVLEKVQTELSKSGTFDPAVNTPEELIATALGSWIASKFVDDRSGLTPSLGEGGLSSTQNPADTDQLLAAALGACQCWGHNAACPSCNGAGVAGWTVPDQQLFVHYVGPAVAAARSAGVGLTTDISPSIQSGETNSHD